MEKEESNLKVQDFVDLVVWWEETEQLYGFEIWKSRFQANPHGVRMLASNNILIWGAIFSFTVGLWYIARPQSAGP